MHPWQRGLEFVSSSTTFIRNDCLQIRTLEPGEVPALQFRFCLLEVRGGVLGFSVALGYGESEIRVWVASIGLAAIDRCMDLEADVEELTGKKVRSA